MGKDERRGREKRRMERKKKKEEEEGVNVIDTIQRGDDSHGENLEMEKGKREERREEGRRGRGRRGQTTSPSGRRGKLERPGEEVIPFRADGRSRRLSQPYGLSGKSHTHRQLALLYFPSTGACWCFVFMDYS